MIPGKVVILKEIWCDVIVGHQVLETVIFRPGDLALVRDPQVQPSEHDLRYVRCPDTNSIREVGPDITQPVLVRFRGKTYLTSWPPEMIDYLYKP